MFGTVSMLYVDLEVNGVPVKAFVDSGAQMTIITQVCGGVCRVWGVGARVRACVCVGRADDDHHAGVGCVSSVYF